MDFQPWWLWMIFAAIFAIGEIFTSGFFLLWFGIGAAIAGVLAIFNIHAVWQWVSFLVISLFLVAVSRKFADKLTKTPTTGIGSDRFIGKKGVVLEKIDNIRNTGYVRIDKEKWRADSEKDKVINKDEIIIVTKIEGVHLIVKPFKEGEEV